MTSARGRGPGERRTSHGDIGEVVRDVHRDAGGGLLPALTVGGQGGGKVGGTGGRESEGRRARVASTPAQTPKGHLALQGRLSGAGARHACGGRKGPIIHSITIECKC